MESRTVNWSETCFLPCKKRHQGQAFLRLFKCHFLWGGVEATCLSVSGCSPVDGNGKHRGYCGGLPVVLSAREWGLTKRNGSRTRQTDRKPIYQLEQTNFKHGTDRNYSTGWKWDTKCYIFLESFAPKSKDTWYSRIFRTAAFSALYPLQLSVPAFFKYLIMWPMGPNCCLCVKTSETDLLFCLSLTQSVLVSPVGPH